MKSRKLFVSAEGRRWMLDRVSSLEIEIKDMRAARTSGGMSRAELGLGHEDGESSAGLDADATLQSRIREFTELTDILANSDVAPLQKNTDLVHLGVVVKLTSTKGPRRTKHVYIGGHYDGRIPWTNLPRYFSAVVGYDCEVGKTLIGLTVGDEVTIKGQTHLAGTWEIDEIKIPHFHKAPEAGKAANAA